jgi:hypothetical protein
MKSITLVAGAASLLLAAAPAWSGDVTSTNTRVNPDGSTTATQTAAEKKGGAGAGVGVAGGAMAGAVVAGPLGAALGAVVGGAGGAAADPPKTVKTDARLQTAPPPPRQP